MKFYLGLVVGMVLGGMLATTYLASAQLAPFNAPLDEQLNGQRQEQYLRLERELERQRYSPLEPCRR